MSGLTEEQRVLYNQLQNAIKDHGNVAEILQGVSKDDLLAVLNTNGTTIEFKNGAKHTLTLPGLAIDYKNHESIKTILDVTEENNILKEVLATANIHTKRSNGEEHTDTPLSLAMNYNNQEIVKTILDAVKEKDILKDVLTTPGAIKNEKLGSKYTHTPLSLAINYNKQEIIEVILVAAREQGILEKVLTTADIVEVFQNGKKHTIHTVTPLNFAIQRENHKSIKAILDAAKEQGILKEVFAGIEKGDLEKIKTIAKKAGDQDILDKILEVEKSISENEAMKRNPPTDGSATQSLKNKAKTINKPIIIGGVCGAIAALAVGVGCGVAGVQLSVLAIVGIAVAAALAVGIVAGVITYAVLKPSGRLEEAHAQEQEEKEKVPA